jgi:molybdopterin-containing oxidoreductase family iron-sulfur binding subunit
MPDHDHHHHAHDAPTDVNRRTFLKLAGFAFSGAMVGGCTRAPVQYAVPPLAVTEAAIPGRPVLYASTCDACSAGCGMLVKTRDGRPIKLEGSPNHPRSRGGLCAVGQASILGLYDRQRLQQPLKNGEASSWATVDGEIRTRLEELRRQGKAIRFLSSTVTSPTTRAAIDTFLARFQDAQHVTFDPISASAIREAHQRTHGVRALPQYQFEQAQVIVSFAADFLGAWIDPVGFAVGYQAGRFLQGTAPRLSYHVQIESKLSLTGSKADQRLCTAPGELGLVMSHLARRVAQKASVNWGGGELEVCPVPAQFLDELAERLWDMRGRSLVLCGTQDIGQQLVCNVLNHLLGNYGRMVDIEHPSYQNQSNDTSLHTLLEEIRQGRVGALFVYRSNPLYDLPDGPPLRERVRSVPLVVSFASSLDETASAAGYVCPEPHYLESWSDAEPVDGLVSLRQPTIPPLGESRALLETLATWMGRPRSAYEQLRESWQANVYPRSLITVAFQEFWEQSLHDGTVRVRPRGVTVRPFEMAGVTPIRQARRDADGTFTAVVYPKVSMPDGRHAYNPWLQELPDPLTKITWDNYASLSPATATRLGLSQGDVVRIEGGMGGTSLELPVVVQPGQHDKIVAVALGYGSKLSERFAQIGPPWLEAQPTVGADGLVGVNAAPLLAWNEGTLQHTRDGIRLMKTNRQYPLACTQDQPTLRIPLPLAPAREPEPIIRETTLTEFLRGGADRPAGETREDLWPDDHPTTGPRWGLAIDLSGCTGCSACVVACQVENNIPVVGKDEVRRHREMHWMRIDRYYMTPAKSPIDGGPRRDSEVDVGHQPMLCQHCGNAPCEVVCPVLATVHSSEGLNQQVYNRCVGTRYCANNCPYKVRRFNWFDYAHDDQLQNLVLNPDVTVRSRGIMEKCTLCIQRIQEAKIEARRLGLPLGDGDIQTACQQSCPTQAIVFGNLNDPTSRAAHLAKSKRAYHVLEELNVQSAVSYLGVVRHRPDPALGGQRHE